MKYDILLFDADDTLFDFYHTGQTSFLKACKSFGIDATEKDYDIYSDINQKRWDLFSLGKISKEDVLLGRFEEYAKVKNIELNVPEFSKLYEQNLSETAILYTETKDMLAELKKLGARIFLITNGIKKVQRRRLALSGIQDYFEGIFISDEIGCKKPSVEYFDYVSSRIENFNPTKTLIIGDSLVSDIALGINNDIDTCWFNGNNLPNVDNIKPKYTISSLVQIFDIVNPDKNPWTKKIQKIKEP